MPISAASYAMDRAFEGQIASLQKYCYIEGTKQGYKNADTIRIPFGRFVTRGTNYNDIVLPSATGQDLLGVTVVGDFFEKDPDGETSGYPIGEETAIMRVGAVYMIAETALSAGDSIFVRHTVSGSPGAFDGIGRIRADADTATADALPLAEARVEEDVSAGGIVIVSLDIPLK